MYSEDTLLPGNHQYRRAIGKLSYIATKLANMEEILCRKASNTSQAGLNTQMSYFWSHLKLKL